MKDIIYRALYTYIYIHMKDIIYRALYNIYIYVNLFIHLFNVVTEKFL